MSRPGAPLGDSVYNGIPKELRSLRQWLTWLSVPGEDKPVRLPNGQFTAKPLKAQDKPHKLPIVSRTGGLAATTRKATWGSLEDAIAAVAKLSVTGIGFVFSDSDRYSGVDLDNCRTPETGEIKQWAWEIIRALDSYTEYSPSGTGVHIIVIGTLPKSQGNQAVYNDGKVEMFSHGRYFTVTAQRVPGTPSEILDRHDALLKLHAQLFASRHRESRQRPAHSQTSTASDRELLDKALQARNSANFKSLWDGMWKRLYPSQSEADLALCCHLAFWTGKDAARIASLFRQSGLMREKWERPDYLERTINHAISLTRNVYTSGRDKDPKFDGKQRSVIGNNEADSGPEEQAPNLLPFPHTDTGNAERLVKFFGDEIRYCTEMKKWLVWDGRRWVVEATQPVTIKRLFKKTMREMHKQAADIADKDQRLSAEAHARRSESARAINAALECAQSEDGISISANSLDTHAYLLNCLNGTLDLLTGQLHAHDRDNLITKIVHVNYRAAAACPQFLRFLCRIMGDNPDANPTGRAERLVGYLQKALGSALTADVGDKAVFCMFGSGNNGKTTLLEAVRFILREYAGQVLIDSLMAHKSRESSTTTADLAQLRGVRFVTTSETEEGQRLAVAKLKYLTQGMGEIKACRKYENPITFPVTHKLFLDANHKPIIRGAENAVWNRLKTIPFLVTIPSEEIDKGLLEKLKLEAEGILAWMVEGCGRWRREGLGDLAEIAEASALWQAESDRFSEFFDEHYEIGPGWVPVSFPWRAYRAWCDGNNEEPLTKMAFEKKLIERGCKKGFRESGTIRTWNGIRPQRSGDPSFDVVTSDIE